MADEEKATQADATKTEAATINGEADLGEEIATETTTRVADEPKPTKRRRKTAKSDDIVTIPQEPVSEKPEETIPEQEDIPEYLPVITIDKGSRGELEDEDEIAWHDLKNAFLTKHILSGVLEAVEITPNDHEVVAVTFFNGQKIIIPAHEMIETDEKLNNTAYTRILSSMIGAEISYVILSMSNASKVVVASRNKASERNRKTFYFDKDSQGHYKIYEGSTVEARIVGMGRNSVTLEIFGVLVNVPNGELSWTWLNDVSQLYAVGDRVMVKITKIVGRDDNQSDTFYVNASIKQAQVNLQEQLINKVRRNDIYIGTIVDIRKGTFIIQLANGLQVFSHSSHSRKKAMKGDKVSFVVNYINKENLTVTGTITRIIKQGRP